jgi:hypothetical protein
MNHAVITIRTRHIIAFIVLLLVTGWIKYCLTPEHPLSEKAAYAMVAREVPAGTSRSDIEHWIESKGWGASYGYRFKSLDDMSGHFKGRPEDMTGYVGVLIPDNTRIFLGNGDLLMVFYLDKDDCLIQFYGQQILNTL